METKEKYHCELCGCRCQKQQTLMQHLKQKHKKEIVQGLIAEIEPIKCEICDEKFAVKTEKNEHKKKEHAEQIKAKKCKYCGEIFIRVHQH